MHLQILQQLKEKESQSSSLPQNWKTVLVSTYEVGKNLKHFAVEKIITANTFNDFLSENIEICEFSVKGFDWNLLFIVSIRESLE